MGAVTRLLNRRLPHRYSALLNADGMEPAAPPQPQPPAAAAAAPPQPQAVGRRPRGLVPLRGVQYCTALRYYVARDSTSAHAIGRMHAYRLAALILRPDFINQPRLLRAAEFQKRMGDGSINPANGFPHDML